jgi:hypothetical protein
MDDITLSNSLPEYYFNIYFYNLGMAVEVLIKCLFVINTLLQLNYYL